MSQHLFRLSLYNVAVVYPDLVANGFVTKTKITGNPDLLYINKLH